jgi:hypothetical protein
MSTTVWLFHGLSKTTSPQGDGNSYSSIKGTEIALFPFQNNFPARGWKPSALAKEREKE